MARGAERTADIAVVCAWLAGLAAARDFAPAGREARAALTKLDE